MLLYGVKFSKSHCYVVYYFFGYIFTTGFIKKRRSPFRLSLEGSVYVCASYGFFRAKDVRLRLLLSTVGVPTTLLLCVLVYHTYQIPDLISWPVDDTKSPSRIWILLLRYIKCAHFAGAGLPSSPYSTKCVQFIHS